MRYQRHLAGINDSGDDATVVANSNSGSGCSKRDDRRVPHHSQNRLSLETVSLESVSLSGERQYDSSAPNWSTGNDNGSREIPFLKKNRT